MKLGDVAGRQLAGGGTVYQGVPFAMAPVGERRFMPPAKATELIGDVFASVYPPPPIQGLAFRERLGHGEEDCLYLNVWSPSREGRRPVVVWLYGGGFEGGSASPPWSDGESLMHFGDVVVVACNYRLGGFGFLHLGLSDEPAWREAVNVGHLDQVAALEWVKENIVYFGGDPGNVTLAGESAGAFSIGALAAMPSARGLFHKAFFASGSASRTLDREAAGEQLRLAGGQVPGGLEGLRRLPAEEIAELDAAVLDRDFGVRNSPGGRIWAGVVDGRVLTEQPENAVAAGALKNMPVVTACTTEEARAFEVAGGEPYAPSGRDALLREMRAGVGEAAEALLAEYERSHRGLTLARLRSVYLTDYIYRARSVRLAGAQTRAGGRSWVMLFGYGSARLGEAGGAHHGLIGYYLMGVEPFPRGDERAGAIRRRLAEVVSRLAWGDDPGWPGYESGTRPALLIEPEERLVVEPSTRLAEIWDEVRFP